MKIRKLDLQTFPYNVEFKNPGVWDKWEEMYKWCEDTFGPPFDNSVHSFVMDNPKWVKSFGGVRFKEESHAQWFVLRFSDEID